MITAPFDSRIKTVSLAANHTINNSVVLESTTLSIPVASGARYQIIIALYGITPAAADWKFNLTAPAVSPGMVQIINSDSLASVGVTTDYTPNGTGGAEIIHMIGTVVPASDGVVVLKFAQSVATVGNTILYAGSSMTLIRT